MKNVSLKNYLEICHIIIHKKVKESDFTDFFHLSKYEYGVDLKVLFDLETSFGIRIQIDQGIIAYKIVDEEKYKRKYKPCSLFYNTHISQKWYSNNIIRYYLIRRLLISEDFIKLDDLADELLQSRSSLRKDMVFARDYLSDYDIEIISYAGHGMRAVGNEFNIRLCFDSVLNYYESNVIEDSSDRVSEEMFSVEYEKIYHLLNRFFAENSFVISISDITNITRYLIITKNRILNGKQIDKIDNKLGTYIDKSKEYELAKEILKLFEDIEKLEINEFECDYLASYLAICREYSDISESENAFVNLLPSEQLHELLCNLADSIKTKWNIVLDQELEESFFQEVKRIYVENYFGYLLFKRARRFSDTYSYSKYPLIKRITKDIADEISSFFHIGKFVPYVQLNKIADVLLIYYLKQDLPYRKLSVAVNSKSSTINEKMFTNMLRAYIDNKYCEQIEVAHKKDMDEFSDSSYDIILQDRKIYIKQFGEYVKIDRNIEDINDLCANMIDVCSTGIESIDHKDMQVEDIASFALCVKEYSGNHNIEKQLTSEIDKNVVIDKTLYLFVNNGEYNKPRILSGHFPKPLIVSDKVVDRYVCVFFSLASSCMKLINEIVRSMSEDYFLFEMQNNTDFTEMNKKITKLI